MNIWSEKKFCVYVGMQPSICLSYPTWKSVTIKNSSTEDELQVMTGVGWVILMQFILLFTLPSWSNRPVKQNL